MAKTLGELLEAVRVADDEASAVSEQLRSLQTALRDAEEELYNAMQEQGIDRVRNEHITVSLVEKTRPQVTDWDAFYEVVSENPQLLERRVSAKPYLELLESRGGEAIPGTQLYSYIALQKKRE